MNDQVGTRWSTGLEEGADGRFRAHVLSLVGVEEVGATPGEAVDRLTRTLQRRIGELGRMGYRIPGPEAELEITVEEWVATDAQVAEGESAACFERDREPLADGERLAGLRLLGDLRGRLVPRIRRAKDGDLEAVGPPEATVRAIVDELARAQWWTLTRLGASPLAEVPDRAVARLDTAMALVVQHLAEPDPAAVAGVVEIDGQEWTPRRVLRRLLWLEWSLGETAIHHLERAGTATR